MDGTHKTVVPEVHRAPYTISREAIETATLRHQLETGCDPEAARRATNEVYQRIFGRYIVVDSEAT